MTCREYRSVCGSHSSARSLSAVHRLTKAQARRIAVRAQLLDAPRPTELLTVVQQLTLLQIDPTAAVAPERGPRRLEPPRLGVPARRTSSRLWSRTGRCSSTTRWCGR